MVWRRMAAAVLLVIFLGSTAVILFAKREYRLSEERNNRLSEQYTDREEAAGTQEEALLSAPIRVDFPSLYAENPDTAGWIYCEGTPIDYVVMQAADNDYYLRRSYDGTHSTAGTIFIDAENRAGFADCNTIVYGHNMRNGSMFAVLSEWASQEFYEEHPVLWLLTPKQDYQIRLLAGCTTSAYSDIYTIYQEPGEAFDNYVKELLSLSDFQSDAEAEEGGHYVLLSTCSYAFDNARYVLLGLLVPAEGAGGEGA
ncbi:MAG: class B sortase [Lachnospiraceae bacterium]